MIQRGLHQFVQGVVELAPLLLVEIAVAELLAIDAGGGAEHAGEQRLLGHFQREDGDGLLELQGNMLGDVQGERGFAHGGPRGDDAKIAAVHAAGHFVELGEAGADALDALAGVEEGADAALIALEDLAWVEEAGLDLRIAEFEEGLFGAGEDFAGLFLAEQGAVHHVLRGEDDAPQDGLVFDDADVAVEVGNLREAVVERDEVGEAVAGFQLVELHELVGDGDAVDASRRDPEARPCAAKMRRCFSRLKSSASSVPAAWT